MTQRRLQEPYDEILRYIWSMNAHISYLLLGNKLPQEVVALNSRVYYLMRLPPGIPGRLTGPSRPLADGNQGFRAGWVLLCGILWGGEGLLPDSPVWLLSGPHLLVGGWVQEPSAPHWPPPVPCHRASPWQLPS